MEQRKSTIGCDIDFERDGKQVSFLRLVHSDNRHAFGAIPVPIVLFKNGSGPTVFVSAGNHGDEYEGQIILHELLRTLTPGEVRGRLIVMPALNYPAVLAAQRVSPLDGMNFNRAFPGAADGSPTAQLAHFVETEILARATAAVDLHSGGTATRYVNCAYLHGGGGPDLMRRKIEAARAFGAPYTMVARSTANFGSMTASCDRRGIVMVATELAGAGTITDAALAIGRAGLCRVLCHFGVLAGTPPRDAFAETQLITVPGAKASVMAPSEGLFAPCVDLGAQVRAGDLAGSLYFVGELDRPAVPLHFAQSGMVAIRRAPTLVRRGDYVLQVAVPVTEAELLS